MTTAETATFNLLEYKYTADRVKNVDFPSAFFLCLNILPNISHCPEYIFFYLKDLKLFNNGTMRTAWQISFLQAAVDTCSRQL